MDDIDINQYIKEFENKDVSDAFEDFKLSNCKIHLLISFKIVVKSFLN